MEPTLDMKILYLNSFFNYFYLNKENFSKNIQLQLNLLKPCLKFEKRLLSSIEKDKLLFVHSDSISNKMKNNEEDDKIVLKEMKKLDLLYSIVKRFNLDLKYNKEKMLNSYISNEIEFEKKIQDINYDILLKKYYELSETIVKKNKNIDNNYISNEELIKNKYETFNAKKEIDEIEKKNQKIDLKLYDLKKKLNNYKDLPLEINQIKNLIEIKKEEYKSLLISKKNNKNI